MRYEVGTVSQTVRSGNGLRFGGLGNGPQSGQLGELTLLWKSTMAISKWQLYVGNFTLAIQRKAKKIGVENKEIARV